MSSSFQCGLTSFTRAAWRGFCFQKCFLLRTGFVFSRLRLWDWVQFYKQYAVFLCQFIIHRRSINNIKIAPINQIVCNDEMSRNINMTLHTTLCHQIVKNDAFEIRTGKICILNDQGGWFIFHSCTFYTWYFHKSQMKK